MPSSRRVVATFALSFSVLGVAGHRLPRGESSVTLSVDPCRFATADQLKFVVASGIARFFPIDTADRERRVTLVEPHIESAQCPRLRLVLRGTLRHTSARAADRQTAPVTMVVTTLATVAYEPGMARERLTTANLRRADACVRKIESVTLEPTTSLPWLDEPWLTRWLEPRFAQQFCFPVTSLLFVYLKQGGTL
jgi:hypothetical protein